VALIKPVAASNSGIWIDTDDVMPSAFVGILRIYINADVSVMTHRQSRVASLLYVIFAVYGVLFQTQSFSHPTLHILNCLDYGNQSLIKLQSVLNAAARLVFMSCKFDHVMPFHASNIGCTFLRA